MESLTPPRAFAISDAQERKRIAADEKVAALEKRLEALYRLRAGRPVNAWWAWCARCGARKVNPIRPEEVALVNPGKNRTTQVCPFCEEEIRREKDARAYRAYYLLTHPEDAVADAEKEILAQATEIYRAAFNGDPRSKPALEVVDYLKEKLGDGKAVANG